MSLLHRINTLINKNDHIERSFVKLANQVSKRPFKEGEKVDIVFLFQAASFWPSWETVWEEINNDDRFNPIMILADEEFKETVQFKTARTFLENQGISFKHITEVNLDEINPHITVMHTPYDGHRPRYLHGKKLSAAGHRIVYITYGIEISDIDKARNDHFLGGVTTSAWRLYTFSKDLIRYYKMFSPTGGDMVRGIGHPKFDKLNKDHFPELPKDIREQVGNRKVLLLKVHFPKKVNGKFITPSTGIYKRLLNELKTYHNIFCIFMPHPKFYEELAKFENVNGFKNIIDSSENIVEYNDDDYRPVLVNCDYYIVDRSALMIEAGVTEKPILYVKTSNPEKMTKPVQDIIDTYYQAASIAEVREFLDEVVLLDNDHQKEERLEMLNSIIDYKNQNAGFEIKEDMYNSLKDEKFLDVSDDVSTELTQVYKDYYENLDFEDARVAKRNEQIKNHLSYLIGNRIVKASSFKKIIKLPYHLYKDCKKFKQRN